MLLACANDTSAAEAFMQARAVLDPSDPLDTVVLPPHIQKAWESFEGAPNVRLAMLSCLVEGLKLGKSSGRLLSPEELVDKAMQAELSEGQR